jgi:hypothetical protein
LPGELTAQTADACLPLEPHQGSQALFHGFPFGFEARRAERVPHELIVDDNVGPHDVPKK